MFGFSSNFAGFRGIAALQKHFGMSFVRSHYGLSQWTAFTTRDKSKVSFQHNYHDQVVLFGENMLGSSIEIALLCGITSAITKSSKRMGNNSQTTTYGKPVVGKNSG